MTGIDLSPALPEIVVLAAASTILIVDLFVSDARRYVSYWLTQLALLIATCVTLTNLHGAGVKGFHNMVVADMVADFLRIGCFVSVSPNDEVISFGSSTVQATGPCAPSHAACFASSSAS